MPVLLDDDFASELLAAAERQDRTILWILHRAWVLSRDQIRRECTPPIRTSLEIREQEALGR